MKPWIKWTLIGIALLVLGIIQFVPGEAQKTATPSSATAPRGDAD